MEYIGGKINPQNPRNSAKFLSLLFYGYTFELFRKGYKKVLVEDDIYLPLDNDRSELLGDSLQRKWLEETEKNSSKPSLFKALLKTFWLYYLRTGIFFAFSEIILRVLEPILLGVVLKYYEPKSNLTKPEAIWHTASLVLVSACRIISYGQYSIYNVRNGMRARVACSSLMYRKILKLTKTTDDIDGGKIINLLSNDISRFDMATNSHYIWGAPILTVCVTWFLYDEVGYTGLIGILTIVVVTALQCFTGKLIGSYREQTSQKTDFRIKLMQEIISGVQAVKMYAWEKPFGKLIALARKDELKIIQKTFYLKALFQFFSIGTVPLALFAYLVFSVVLKQDILVSKVYVTITYYNILNLISATMCILAVAEMAELIESIKRIQSFLLSQEYNFLNQPIDFCHKDVLIVNNVTSSWTFNFKEPQKKNKEVVPPINNTKEDLQLIDKADSIHNLDKNLVLQSIGKGCLEQISWEHDTNVYEKNIAEQSINSVLKNITFSAKETSFIGIIGSVGCGKSSLLQTILGETRLSSGNLSINGKISYAPQTSWFFQGTIKQNILFGLEFDEKRYQEVVSVCCLELDFEMFSNRDDTLVGNGGASLSGGQKARITLARAIYRPADIYLLDDPLAAVDVQVAKDLYDGCINKFLKNKCKILVTHCLHFLSDADQILLLNEGTIEDKGTFEELSQNGKTYSQLLILEEEQTHLSNVSENILQNSKLRRHTLILEENNLGKNEEKISFGSVAESLVDKEYQKQSSKIKSQFQLLFKYFAYGGNFCTISIMLLLFILAQVSISTLDCFVSYWTNIEEVRHILMYYTHTPEYFLYICTGLILSLTAFCLIRSIYFFKFVIWSSQKLHDNLFDNVIRAEMKFFYTNSEGRILNRFSKDIGAIDTSMPRTLAESIQIFLNYAAAIFIIIFINPYFVIVIIMMSGTCLVLNYIYLNSTLDIKRIEGKLMGPIYTHVSSSFDGLISIRAFETQNVLLGDFHSNLDKHSGAWFMYLTASNAFGFFIDFICFVFMAVVISVLVSFEDNIRGNEVGLAITQAMALSGVVQWGMRQAAEASNYLISVERLLTYNNLPKELEPPVSSKLSQNWPTGGKIVFKNVSVKYDPQSAAVLTDLNFEIRNAEKVGIIGRTGAGKSSLIAAIFKLCYVQGSIEIDDVNTNNIRLKTLRSKISIIPQDPVLFSGTLRSNLDPFNEYEDSDLYRAISEVELNDSNHVLYKLESIVTDRGANYSVGQKQLICLARAIVRKTRILILDEATASVDPQTDKLIQNTIRKKFSDRTVLTIAHRLNTIIDCDRIMVVDSGQVLEFDHPHILLENPEGKFSEMVRQTGHVQTKELRKVAVENYHTANQKNKVVNIFK